MKAVIYERYGSPDVLQVTQIAKPEPNENQVLIRVKATTVTAAEGMMRRGDTLAARLILGLRKPAKKYRVLGIELAGVVEKTGEQVTRFKAGDEVFGFTGFTPGAYAEYMCLSENASIVKKPLHLSFEKAVSMVDGASTAFCFLMNKAGLKAGRRVLIIGASGSIGTYAVQIAKQFGAHVTGVCSGANAKMVTSLGADKVIDYTKENYETLEQSYDVIFDTIGKGSFFKCKKILNAHGKYLVTTGNFFKLYFLTLWTNYFSRKKFIYTMSVEKSALLEKIKELAEQHQLQPVIDRQYPIDEIVQAHEYMETGRKKGNVVIRVY